MIFSVGDELFSIPSPVQTAFLIKNSGAAYNAAMLNDPKNAATYSTKFIRSLNLGIYGADLGYVTIYEQTQDALSFMNSARKLSDDLGVSSAFSKDLLTRFQANLGNRDSLLVLVSDAFRSSDSYLKENDRDDVGSLILAGGWIESLHFTTNIAKNNSSPEVIRRIGEQKTSLENLIKLLQRYANDEDFADFVEELIDLYYLFSEVQITYTYAKAEQDPENKITYINSTSEVTITEEQLNNIAAKVSVIRSRIVG